MTRRRILRGGLLTIAVVALAGVGAFWWVFLRDDTPSEAALVDREVVADPVGDLDGSWTVVPGRDVWAGYRITEDFQAVHNTAVARTVDVDGRLVVAGTQVTEASLTADLATLTSQDSQVPGVGNR